MGNKKSEITKAKEEFAQSNNEVEDILDRVKNKRPTPMPAYDDGKPHPTPSIAIGDDGSKKLDPNKKGSRRPL